MPSISQSFQENPLSTLLMHVHGSLKVQYMLLILKPKHSMRGKYIWPIKTDKFYLLEKGYNDRTADPHYLKEASSRF